jgi:hypothetical protein
MEVRDVVLIPVKYFYVHFRTPSTAGCRLLEGIRKSDPNSPSLHYANILYPPAAVLYVP